MGTVVSINNGTPREFLNRLFSPISGNSPAVSLRVQIKATGFWHSGYFNDGLSGWSTLTKAILQHDGINNTYVSLNPLKQNVLTRGRDRIAPGVQAYDDEDVLRRWNLIIDFDPRRPKSNTCATNDEKAHAHAKALEVHAWLTARGWPAPLFLDSGNGYYLIYRIDLACNQKTDALITDCLHSLDQIFTDAHVKIDATMGDRGQLVRMVGTMNVKGENATDRPWRRSTIIEGPATFAERAVVDEILLEPLAAMAVHESKADAKKSDGWGFDIARYLADFKIEHRGPFDIADGEKWTFDLCPFKGEHSHHATEAIAIRMKSGFVLVRCSHDTCAGLSVADMRDAWEGASWHTQKPDPYRPDIQEATKAKKIVGSVLKNSRLVLFHDPENVAYATVTSDAHEATYRLDSEAFELWLKARCLDDDLSTAARDLVEAIGSLTAIAQVKGEERRVFLRHGQDEAGNCYVDLGRKDWRILAIRKDGTCSVIPYSQCGCRFWRSRQLASLPIPELGTEQRGILELLGKYENCSKDELKIVLAAAVFELILPKASRPILVFTGDKGSGKSSAAKTLKFLVDPMGSDLAACAYNPLKNERDLASAANSTSILEFDNQSWIPKALSDEICFLSTGGTLAERELYRNHGLASLEARHMQIFTAINDQLLTEQDALDRAFYIHTRPMEGDDGPAEGETTKIEDEQFESDLDADRPRILGALAGLAAVALRDYRAITLTYKTRLTTFQRIGCAVLQALGHDAGDFTEIVKANRKAGTEQSLDGDIVVEGISVVVKHRPFTGTRTALHTAFCASFADDKQRRRRDFPDTPTKLSLRLLKLTGALKLKGLFYRKPKRTHDGWILEVGRTDSSTYEPAAKEQPRLTNGHGAEITGDGVF